MSRLLLFLLACWQPIETQAHGYLSCPQPRQRRDVKPEVWTNWMGITVPGDESFAPGEGNAANNNAGIGGGPSGATREKSEGHGLCGDIGSRKGFMAGGAYGPTMPRGVFRSGGLLQTSVKISAFHAGWFEFRLCVPADGGLDVTAPITQSCLNEHVLEIDSSTPEFAKHTDYLNMKGISGDAGDGGWYKCASTGGHTDPTANTPNTDWPTGTCCNGGGACSPPDKNVDRFVIDPPASTGNYDIVLKIPSNTECDRCVLQWTYQTANSREAFPETFWNCADIRILAPSDPLPDGLTETGCQASVPTAVPTIGTGAPPAPSPGPPTNAGGGGGAVGGYCATTWEEVSSPGGATCIPCSSAEDTACPAGKACWAATYCSPTALCGQGVCEGTSPTKDFDCSPHSAGATFSCQAFSEGCAEWCKSSQDKVEVMCRQPDATLPLGTSRNRCACPTNNGNAVCFSSGGGAEAPSPPSRLSEASASRLTLALTAGAVYAAATFFPII